MTLMKIRLELARTPEFPEGSSQHGYEFTAPVDQNGLIDVEAWKKHEAECTVLHFWNGDEEHGHLRHTGSGWRFDYNPADAKDDEPFFKLDRHKLEPDAYVSVTEHDGKQRPFRIVSMRPLLLKD
jgi:hypothetical protein